MSVEQELKLHVQIASRHAVKELINTSHAETIHLHAIYFDTCQRELAQAGVALRLRKEQEGWIQTIKLLGDDSLSKIEYNHPRPDATLDLDIYTDTPAAQIFKQLKHDLFPRFETDIYRTLKLQNTNHGVIELAYDTGLIRSADLSLAVCELELELKEGSSEAIFELADRWQQQYEFILDFRSKAERGDTLASFASQDKALNQDFPLWRPWSIDQAKTNQLKAPQRVALYLEQIARNAAIISGIDRKDIKTSLTLDLTQHLASLSDALQMLQTAYTNNNDDAETKALLQQLQHYDNKLSALQSSEQALVELVSSRDFQALLLDILARTILNS